MANNLRVIESAIGMAMPGHSASNLNLAAKVIKNNLKCSGFLIVELEELEKLRGHLANMIRLNDELREHESSALESLKKLEEYHEKRM